MRANPGAIFNRNGTVAERHIHLSVIVIAGADERTLGNAAVRTNGDWLEIQDEGKGIAPEKKSLILGSGPLGVGLRGMRERVRQLGGTLEIESNGTGTTVRAMFPVAKSISVSAREIA